MGSPQIFVYLYKSQPGFLFKESRAVLLRDKKGQKSTVFYVVI